MNCTQINKKLIFLIDNTLSKEEKEMVSAHITECNECLGQYNFLKETISLIEREKIVEPDPYFFTRLEQKLENVQAKEQKIRSWFKPQLALRTIGYSMLIVLGILSGIFIGNYASEVIYSSSDIKVSTYESDLSINEMYDEVIELSFYYE